MAPLFGKRFSPTRRKARLRDRLPRGLEQTSIDCWAHRRRVSLSLERQALGGGRFQFILKGERESTSLLFPPYLSLSLSLSNRARAEESPRAEDPKSHLFSPSFPRAPVAREKESLRHPRSDSCLAGVGALQPLDHDSFPWERLWQLHDESPRGDASEVFRDALAASGCAQSADDTSPLADEALELWLNTFLRP